MFLAAVAILFLAAATSCHKKPAAPATPKPAAHSKAPEQKKPGAPEKPAAPGSAKITPYEDVNSSADKVIEKYYPRVSGLGDPAVETAINTAIEQAAGMNAKTRMLMEDKEYNPQFTSQAKVTYNRNGILSLSVFQTFTAEGMPNESYIQTSRTFRLEDGAQLALADLFAPHTDWAARIDSAMRNRVAADNIHLLREYEGIAAPGDKSGFYLTDDGIALYYQIYDYTSYMDGFLEVTIPWSAVQDILAAPLQQAS
jgi:hypothetical protein